MDNLFRLLKIMQTLRDPENGCPWDIQQTFDSILPYTIEEVYEVADAIDQKDFVQLKDELGDLLLQIVYYTQMAREQNMFDLEDVAGNICDKLVRRHPHVFAKDIPEAQQSWEELKQEERDKKLIQKSLLNDIPSAMPQLMRAKKIQKRVANIGFDWKELAAVIEKVEEELNELKEVIESDQNKESLEEELGDVLFSVVNLSRHIKVNAEEALRKSNKKFIKRFQFIENCLENENKDIKECSLDELEAYWQQAKKYLN
ncbi:MAG: nucleoside triphosphate pyrophosphohydrolase [Pseudomonadota bacterium]